MYLKQITASKTKGMSRSCVDEISHEGVTLRIRTRRVNCVRYQTLEVIYTDMNGLVARTGPRLISELTERAYVTDHTHLKNAILAWLKQSEDEFPMLTVLALRGLINRNLYITPLVELLKKGYRETQYPCEHITGVSLTSQRASMVFPSIKGHFIRLDFRLKQKKYVTHLSITHPDRVMENAAGEKVPVVYTENRYGLILGTRGLYSLLSTWYSRSTAPNVDMLKETGTELLALVNGDRRRMIDEFLTIINGQVSERTAKNPHVRSVLSSLSPSSD